MRAEQALAYFKRRRETMQLMEEDAAIWALEKQIPKKPIKDDDNMTCPRCGTIIGMSPYCAKCGQALDWGKRPINYEIYLQDLTALMNRYGDDNENCITCKDCLNCGCRKERTMTNQERKQTGLLHSADELKRLVLEHQELPILVLAGDNANTGDYGFMSCSRVRAQEGEFLDCKQKIDACKCYTDRDDFEDDVADFLAGEEQYRDLPDDEFNALVEQTVNEYDDFWKPCILLLVDN